MDRSRWRKLIKDVDDQDRCEWVTVPSGTGSLGQSRTKGRKTVVVVVVAYWQLNLHITPTKAQLTEVIVKRFGQIK